jgi:molybdenum cofactor guanylyltransferase
VDNDLAVIILAGGHSSRMGSDKAAIEIAGVPLIRRIYDVVAAGKSVDRIYVITPWPEKYRSILPPNCNFILERQPHHGPLVGFSQGLAEVKATWVLLLACDLPNLSTLAIESWIDNLPLIDSQTIAYLPRNPAKGWEPLCGFYRQMCHDSAIAYINAGGRSFQAWLKLNLVEELVITDPRWLINCNTPADLAMISNDLKT